MSDGIRLVGNNRNNQNQNNDQDDTDYDPSQFRVPASDTKGHNARVWARCQPGHAQQLEHILQSKKFPYRCKGDILRHALLRHLIWLESLEPMRSVTGQVDAILEVLRDEEFASDFRSLFDKLGERISSHIGQGAEGEARRLILSAIHAIDQMPEGYWKEKYKSEVDSRWGYLIKNAGRASLRPMVRGGE